MNLIQWYSLIHDDHIHNGKRGLIRTIRVRLNLGGLKGNGREPKSCFGPILIVQ